MNALDTFYWSVAVVVSTGITYAMYTMVANDEATSKLDRAEKEIDELLGAHTMYTIASGDVSPSEVRYTLIKNAIWGLPSRVMLRYIKDLKAGVVTTEDIYKACLKRHQAYQAHVKKKETI